MGDGWPQKPREQQPRRHRRLLHRENQRHNPRRRIAPQQMRRGRRGHRSPPSATQRRKRKHQHKPRRGKGQPTRQKHQRHLAHPQSAIANDKTAAAQLKHQRGKGRDGDINPHPSRIDRQILDDGRRNHRGQAAAQRGEALLHEHGAKRQEHPSHLTAKPHHHPPQDDVRLDH